MVYVLIPAYNEEDVIEKTVKAINLLPQVNSIIVIDDGSTDRTAHLAHAGGVEVFSCQRNLGKGRALLEYFESTGFLSRISEDDVIVLVDADTGETAREIVRLVDAVKQGADCATGILPPAKKKGGFGLVKWLARMIIRKNCGFEPKAPLSGQRAFSGKLLKHLLPAFKTGFGLEVAITLLVCRYGFRYVEVPVSMSHRETGRNIAGFLHRGRQFLDILRVAVELND